MKPTHHKEKMAAIAAKYAVKRRMEALHLPNQGNETIVSEIYSEMTNDMEKMFGFVPDINMVLEEMKRQRTPMEDLKDALCSYDRRGRWKYIEDIDQFIKRDPVFIVRAEALLCMMENPNIPEGSVLSFGYSDVPKYAEIILRDSGIGVIPFNRERPLSVVPRLKKIVFNSVGMGSISLRRAIENLLKNSEKGTEVLLLVTSGALGTGYHGIINQLKDYRVKRIKSFPTPIFSPWTGAEVHILEFSIEPPGERVEIVDVDTVREIETEKLYKLDSWVPSQVLLNMELAGVPSDNWVSLRDVAETIPSGEFKIRRESEGDKEYLILRANYIKDRKIDMDMLLSDKNARRKAKESLDDYLIKPGDVVMVVKGNVGKMAIVPEKFPENVIISNNLLGIRFKDMSPEILEIFLESEMGKKILKSKITGNILPMLKRRDLLELKIPKISKEKERKIIEKYRKIEEEYRKRVEEATKKRERDRFILYKEMGLLAPEKDGDSYDKEQ